MNGEHWRDYFDSQYLGSWDLPRDRDVVVQIEKVVRGDLVGQRGKKDKKALITFKGKEKTFAANVTNCKTIATMYGPNPRGWVGKSIALYVAENVDSPNGPVDAIRIRPRIPTLAKANGGKGKALPPPAETTPSDASLENDASESWQPEEPPAGALESDNVPS